MDYELIQRRVSDAVELIMGQPMLNEGNLLFTKEDGIWRQREHNQVDDIQNTVAATSVVYGVNEVLALIVHRDPATLALARFYKKMGLWAISVPDKLSVDSLCGLIEKKSEDLAGITIMESLSGSPIGPLPTPPPAQGPESIFLNDQISAPPLPSPVYDGEPIA